MKFKKILFFALLLKSNIYCNNILLISIPKCGTHLLAKAIELLTNKNLAGEFKIKDFKDNNIPEYNDANGFYRAHLEYNPILAKKFMANKFKLFFIYRDPRDHLISRSHWRRKFLKHMKPLPTVLQVMDMLIKEDLNKYYLSFMPWANLDSVCAIKFENLVGPQGGGNRKLQLIELRKIAKFLDIAPNLIEDSIINCAKNLYGGTFTFREGKIGSWKKDLPKNKITNVKKQVGKLLISLGYEKDLKWK